LREIGEMYGVPLDLIWRVLYGRTVTGVEFYREVMPNGS
jgi:hypothetical protein